MPDGLDGAPAGAVPSGPTTDGSEKQALVLGCNLRETAPAGLPAMCSALHTIHMIPIPAAETLTVEFKSDLKCLSDSDLVLAVVCMANAEGGSIYLGIEDDGQVTGLHIKHQVLDGLGALIANRTSPPVSVVVQSAEEEGRKFAKIDVPKQATITTTVDGKCVRRRLDHLGKPECVPFLPHEFSSRLSHLGAFDFSAQVVGGAGFEIFDPVERARLRKAIDTNALADKTLLKLSDDDLDAALGFVRLEGGERRPTFAGLLCIGHEASIRQHVPTHEVAFQAFKGTRVTVNQFFSGPLVRIQEELETFYRAHVIEEEVQVGLFRVAVPNVDHQAYREAVVNALTHRDYAQRGQIYVQWKEDLLMISSPGGFLDGVTPQNILSVPPMPRNPSLAMAFKRLGYCERSGRGVDIIYEGLVKYGRPLPRFDRSSAAAVIVDVNAADANLKFVELVTREQNRRGESLPLSALLVLNALLELRRTAVADITEAIPVLDQTTVRQQLEQLVEAGLVQAHGVKKGRTYTLSPAVYGKLGRKTDYVRQAGIGKLQQEPMILAHIDTFGSIRRQDVMALCGLSKDQASKRLADLTKKGSIEKHGERRGAYYTRPGSGA